MYSDMSYKSYSNLEPLEVKETFVSTENMTAFLVVALLKKICYFLLPVQCVLTENCFMGLMGFLS